MKHRRKRRFVCKFVCKYFTTQLGAFWQHEEFFLRTEHSGYPNCSPHPTQQTIQKMTLLMQHWHYKAQSPVDTDHLVANLTADSSIRVGMTI